jgi:hypothetical protein
MIARGRSGRGTRERSIQTSSVEPPPMSTTSSCSVLVETSGAQETTARRASSSGWMISSARPVSRLTSAMNSAALVARRQASVATRRIRSTRCLSSFLRQILSAPTARAMDARPSLPEASSPCPSWTDFENESTTWSWLPLGWAISMRQELVPRSSAA